MQTRRIGEKNGSKRHLLVDGRGVPLSLVVTGANRHDVSQLGAVLEKIMVKRAMPIQRRSKHLCADAGYTGQAALQLIEQHGYIPHVKGRHQEQQDLSAIPARKRAAGLLRLRTVGLTASASCWCVMKNWSAVSGLNHLAAAIIAFRKVPLKVNIIYG